MAFRKLFYLFLLASSFLAAGCSVMLYQQGRNLMDDKDYDSALLLLKQETQNNPDNADAWRDIGICYYKKNDLKNSEENLQHSYGMKKSGETILYLGLLSEAAGDYDKAIGYYKECSGISTDKSVTDQIEGRISFIIRQKMEQEIKFALQNEDKLSSDSAKPNTIAVLTFQNLGSNRELDPLQKGLTDMLITDLSKVNDLKVVERVKLQKLLDEMKLSSTGAFEQSTAPRLGKLIKAGRLIKGTYLDQENDKLRVDVNFIGTQDGSSMEVKNISGSLADYFRLEKELAFNIIEKMGITLTDKEREAIQIIPTESFLAFVAYSKGLDYQDRGMMNEAMQQFNDAVKLDPSFRSAETKVNEVNNAKSSADFENKVSGGQLTKPETAGRLTDGAANLTGEYISGQDDRNPNSNSGFGKTSKVEIIIKR